MAKILNILGGNPTVLNVTFRWETIVFASIIFFGLLSPESYAADGLKSSSPVNITADTLVVDQEGSTATFSGNVKALQEDVALQAEKMVVHYLKESQGSNSISSIEVHGNVQLSRRNEVAKGDNGVYDVIKNILTLTGKVVLSKDKNMVQGTNLVYNLGTGKSQISGGKTIGNTPGGRVTGTFVPAKKDK